MTTKTRKIVTAALMTALVFIATFIIKIPSPLQGYMNLGDCVVLLSGWLLSPMYAFFAAGIGSLLADIFAGYMMYAPVTFVIKGLMALCAHFIYKALCKKTGKLPSQITGGILAELIMIFGYYTFEGFLYGFIPSLANMPANVVQGFAGLILGILLVKIFEKYISPKI